MKNFTLLILLVFVVLLNACSPAVTLTPASKDIQNVIEATEVNILIQELALDPVEIAVHVGTTVTWFNLDAARHTVTADAGAFESPTLLFGDSFSFTFDEPGEYHYFNKYHRDIKGKITVVP